MAIDHDWLEKLESLPDLDERDSLPVHGVELTLPVGTDNKRRERTWKRRVITDIVPDYPVADAPEKMLYRILQRLTDPQRTEHTLHEALSEDFDPLISLYEAKSFKKAVPVAFHVLAVNSVRRRMRYRVFKEKTFLLLCRDASGKLDESLIREFVERFRGKPDDVELSQAVVVEHLHPDWRSDDEFTVTLEPFRERIPPFLPKAGQLFRRDLRTLLRVDVPHSHFFRLTNQLLSLHFGLYQNRLATVLNPAIEHLVDGVVEPDEIDVQDLEHLEREQHPYHRFKGSVAIRSPDLSGKRRLPLNAPARESYARADRELVQLHFSLLMLNRIREATKDYLRSTRDIDDEAALAELVRLPSQNAERMKADAAFRQFLSRSFEAMAMRFIEQELPPEKRDEGRQILKNQDNGLRAMLALYKFEARVAAPTTNKNRAVRAGIQVLDALLRKNDAGLVNSRRGVGKYFELGSGLIPLLLMLIVGENEKVQLDSFWDGLAEYGLSFAPEDRELLLSRLKLMGLYERFSDAGEANYVRSLLSVA